MLSNKLKLTAAAAALALAGFAGSAQAAPISGNSGFSIGGALQGDIANGFDFLNNIHTFSGTGAYAGIPLTGLVQDITSFTSFAPITKFLDFGGGLTVDLTSINSVTHTSTSNGNTTKVTGTGTCNIPGADPTTCTIILTGNTNPGGQSPSVSGSVSVPGGTAVPEPASAALLGGALLGLGVIRRRKQR